MADAHSGDTIRFLDSLDGQTITLTHGPLESCNLFENSATEGGALYNNTLTIRDSLIWGNTVRAKGGGIANDGRLTLHNASVYQNNAEEGGAIYSFGTLSILHTDITNNIARGSLGGGVANLGSALIRDQSKLLANTAKIGADLYSPGEFLRDGTSIIGVIFPLPTRPRLHHRK